MSGLVYMTRPKALSEESQNGSQVGDARSRDNNLLHG